MNQRIYEYGGVGGGGEKEHGNEREEKGESISHLVYKKQKPGPHV